MSEQEVNQDVQQPVECPQQANAQPIPSAEQIKQMQEIQAAKQGMLNNLGQLYGQFINQIRMFPACPLQQQQAFIRLDEGHFWLQQSIMQAAMELCPTDAPKDQESQPESPQESAPSEAQAPSVEL